MAVRPSWACNMLHTLLPSFVADLVWPERRPAWKLHPTSYLDGLRGLASFIVFICHYTEDNHGYFVPTYGFNGDGVSSLIQLPFLRIIYSGRPMVHIFFVISGFVLSYKPLKSIHSRDLDKCYSVLSSSAFRRPFRLFGPCLVSTFIIAMLAQTGWIYSPAESIFAQVSSWCSAVFHHITWSWGWDQDMRPPYDVHLWTIPIEFAHSMLLFLVVMMLSRVRVHVRQSAIFALMVYCLACAKWAAFEFFAGVFLAEAHVRRSSRPKYFEDFEEPPSARRLIRHPVLHYAVHLTVFISALFVGGWPNRDHEKTPGIGFLFAHTPKPFYFEDNDMAQRFWFALAATFTVWSCGEVAFVQRFLEGPFSQYFGRLSYAIYIVHGPVLGIVQGRVVGRPYVPARGREGMSDYKAEVFGAGVKGVFGDDGSTQRMMSWFMGLFIIAPVVVWVADLFWRLVDIPMISLARRLEGVCLDRNGDGGPRGTEGHCAA